MSDFVVIAIAFSVVGVAALAIGKILNRKELRAMGAARQRLIVQAKTLQDGNVNRFFDECGLAPEDRPAARSILELFAMLLEVSPEKLAEDYQMENLFAISQPECSSDLHPFATEIVEGLASMSDKRRWEQKWSANSDLPRNEDSLVRFIMGMSVPQVLKFFAPLMERI